jgi:hypothetical protein
MPADREAFAALTTWHGNEEEAVLALLLSYNNEADAQKLLMSRALAAKVEGRTNLGESAWAGAEAGEARAAAAVADAFSFDIGESAANAAISRQSSADEIIKDLRAEVAALDSAVAAADE